MANGEKLGNGVRFKSLEARLSANPKVRNPRALAAAIGRQAYGDKRMTALAKAGQKRARAEAAAAAVAADPAYRPARRVRV